MDLYLGGSSLSSDLPRGDPDGHNRWMTFLAKNTTREFAQDSIRLSRMALS